MKPSYWLYLFLGIFIADLVVVAMENDTLRYVTKPLLMVGLFAYFISSVRGKKSGLIRWMIGALFFSWLGDIFLMFDGQKPFFFLLGLSSFLIAHIFYILLFAQIRYKENIRNNYLLLLPVAIYYGLLMWLLSPYLGDFILPVRIYGAVICIMLLLALHVVFMKKNPATLYIITGALFFVISDSLLAINKFYQPFSMAGLSVMGTYGLAQLFLVIGTIRYILFKNE